MDEIVQMLKDCILFADLSDDAIINEILPQGKMIDVPKDSYLIRFQERFDSFGIVITGKLNMLHIYDNGNYSITDTMCEKDLFGVDLICTKSRVPPYYVVAAQQTRVLSFPVNLILDPGLLSEETRMYVLQNMLSFIADENIRKDYRLAILCQKGLRQRIMTYLTMQADKRHTDTFTVPFTRDELASFLCVNRTCLSHELSKMEKDGLIRFRLNTFSLLKWGRKGGQ